MKWLAQRVTAASDGRLQLEGVSGSLYGPMYFARLKVKSENARVVVKQLSLQWGLVRLWRPELMISSLDAADVDIEITSSQSSSAAPTTDFRWPLLLRLKQTHIERLRVSVRRQPVVFREVQLSGRLNEKDVHFNLQANDGALRLAGGLALERAHSFQLAADLSQLDLAALAALPTTAINLSLKSQGTLSPLDVSLDWHTRESRFNGQALSSNGHVLWTQRHVPQVEMELRLAENRIHAAGAFGDPGDELAWGVSLPRLAQFGRGFAGRLHAAGRLRGSIADPAVTFELAADDILLFSEHKLKKIQGHGRFGAGANDPFAASIAVEGYRGPGSVLDQAEVNVSGTRSAHRIAISARSRGLQFAAAARGGWSGEYWRGEIVRLANQGTQPLALQSPAKLVLARNQIDLSQARFNVAGGELTLARLIREGAVLRTQGWARGIQFSRVLPFLPKFTVPLRASLLLDAQWDLTIGDTVEGMFKLVRTRGDIVLGSNPDLALGLTEFAIDARAERNRIRLGLNAMGQELGRLNAGGELTLVRRNGSWALQPNAPLALAANAHIPSLAWLGKFSAAPLTLGGALDIDLKAAGTFAQPQWRGNVRGYRLACKFPEQGLDWRGGTLAAEFDGSRLQVRQFGIQAGEGKIQIDGWIGVAGTAGDLMLTATRALVSRTANREIIATGGVRVGLRDRRLDAGGDIRVDRARIDLPKQEGPTLSDDVMVVGRQQPAVMHAPLPFTPRVNVNIDFGDRFYIKGQGIDARVTGRVGLSATDAGLPVAHGEVRVAEGTYSAYGQRLQIDKGILTFNGPVDNPALDILALRKNQQVQAGVAITGTALSPVIKLVSTPDVPDSEKLAWLVLGRGLNQASGKDFDLLSAAASSLLSRGESISLQSKIAQRIGVDEFKLSGEGGLENALVTLGKRVSSDIYVAYQRSLSGTTNAFTVKYTLTPRWSVQTQTSSTDTALDLLYTLSFD